MVVFLERDIFRSAWLNVFKFITNIHLGLKDELIRFQWSTGCAVFLVVFSCSSFTSHACVYDHRFHFTLEHCSCHYSTVFLNWWQLRRGSAPFRQHSQGLSWRADKLKTETFTIQSLMRLFSNIWSSLARIMLRVAKTEPQELKSERGGRVTFNSSSQL